MREEDRIAQDPYSPPPRHKDKSGALVRVGLLAAMLGAAAWGYSQFSNTEPLVAKQEQTQQMADAGTAAMPETIPQAEPEAVAPIPAQEAQAAAPSSSRQPAPAPETEDVPPPSTTIGTP